MSEGEEEREGREGGKGLASCERKRERSLVSCKLKSDCARWGGECEGDGLGWDRTELSTVKNQSGRCCKCERLACSCKSLFPLGKVRSGQTVRLAVDRAYFSTLTLHRGPLSLSLIDHSLM